MWVVVMGGRWVFWLLALAYLTLSCSREWLSILGFVKCYGLCAQVFIRIKDDRIPYHNYGLLVIGAGLGRLVVCSRLIQAGL